MPASKECAAAKVLFYARSYSGRQLAENANYASIINGWSTSINRMAALLTSCNKCGTIECENLAKLVAHKWLAAFKIPEKSNTTPSGGSCKKQSIGRDTAAALIVQEAERQCVRGARPTDPISTYLLGAGQANRNEILNASCYKQSVTDIVNALAKGDCNTAWSRINLAGTAFANAYKCNLDAANVGCSTAGTSVSTQPKSGSNPSGPDTDCINTFGLGGLLDGACVSWKKLTKGLEGATADPVNRWFPLILLGFGAIAVLMLFTKR